jgi:tetratricopeptide (TPR) repeat protein
MHKNREAETTSTGIGISGGRVSVSGDLVGGDKVTYESPVPVIAATHQLPPPPADFTGRTTDLSELRKAIETGGVTISGLQGQGGVGKTALALKLAQEIAPHFPDAQIYMDLRGVSEKPLTPAAAMAHVIRAFYPGVKLPEKEAELGGLYRSILYGKRALLLMDNAKDAAQVKPLIPPAGCALLVTSRLHFTLPGLQARNLETLPPADAKALFLRIEPRVGGEAEAIAKLCGYLPLALRLAAAALVERADLAPADYRQRLTSERLKLLAVSDESVEASINLSYGLIDPEMQKRWRMLGIFPDTFDAAAVAAVWGVEREDAQDILGRLIGWSMLEWNDSLKRYRLHDLMRDFADERSEPPERDEAAIRHAEHYLRVLDSAGDLYGKGDESLMCGLALVDIEWGNIEAGQAWAAGHASENRKATQLCNRYPRSGTLCLALRQHPREEIHWVEAALAAARQLNDRKAEGKHLGHLAYSHNLLGGHRLAVKYREQQLLIAHEVHDRVSERNALSGLGWLLIDLGQYRRAIKFFEQVRRMAREAADRLDDGIALWGLGMAHASLGERQRAIEFLEQSLRVLREAGQRREEGGVLGSLGLQYCSMGEPRRAIDYYQEALLIEHEIGDRRGELKSLANMGIAYGTLGEIGHAAEYFQKALGLARNIGDRRGEGGGLWNLGLALDKSGKRDRAIEHAEDALRIFEEIEDPGAEKVRKQLDQWRKD